MNLHEFKNTQNCEIALHKEIIFALNKCIEEKGSVNFYVSGGRSPKALFNNLSKEKLSWEKINVFLVDERLVDSNNDDSNTKLVKENLLINNASKANFFPCVKDDILSDFKSLEEFANSNYLEPDIVILGMGTDGHTASIFPSANNLDELLEEKYEKYVCVKHNLHNRISLNLSAILKAKRIFLNISGEEKYEVLLKASKEENKTYPISFVLSKENCDVYSAR